MALNKQIMDLINDGYTITFSPEADWSNKSGQQVMICIRKVEVRNGAYYITDERAVPAFKNQISNHLQYLIDSLKETK